MSEASTPQRDLSKFNKVPDKGKRLFVFESWELFLLAFAFFMLAFIALPNYFHALEDLRGKECSSRLTLLANCLRYLANENGTQPGEKICELFDLNELLEQVQGGGSVNLNPDDLPFYYKLGAEPDCPEPDGDHIYFLYLDESGNIQLPKCSLADESDGAHFRDRGLHTANETYITGDPFAVHDQEL